MSETTIAAPEAKTFRGGSIEDLLPQIRAELGPDAVVVRQREGLVGGVGGFFQKRCVEVEARAGGPGVDVYDEEPTWDAGDEGGRPRVLSGEEGPAGGAVAPTSTPPPPPPAGELLAADAFDAGGVVDPADGLGLVRNDAATKEGLATAAVQELVGQAQPFAEMLADLGPEPELEGPPRARALVAGMAKAGLGDDLAREIVESVLASAMPFTSPGRLRTAVRNELALRIPVAPAAAPGPRTLAFVGPAGTGKTAALEAIAAAHQAAGQPASICLLSPSGLQKAYGEGEGEGLRLVDTPALHAGAAGLGEVAAGLGALEGAEVHLVLRASTAAAAALEAVEGLAALGPNRLLISGAGETAHLGGVVDAAIRAGLPLSYLAESASELAPADPRALAGRIVP